MNSYIKIILIIFLLISKTSISQDNKQFEVVEYNLILREENITTKLYIKGKKSFHLYSDTKEKSNIDMEKLTFKSIPATKGIFFYKDFKNNTITYKDYIFSKSFIIRDSIPKINWQIYNEEKTIANTYSCKKAVGEFRGRTYTAWFTEQIPISNGPWKLGGLPGLILEAYDEEREVVFDFISLKQTKEGINIEELNIDNPITWKKYAKLWRKKMKTLAPFLQSQMSGDVEVRVKIRKIYLLERSIFEDEKK